MGSEKGIIIINGKQSASQKGIIIVGG